MHLRYLLYYQYGILMVNKCVLQNIHQDISKKEISILKMKIKDVEYGGKF